jgi:hypothetical protein
MKLSALPKAFGMVGDVHAKGWFPHFFNRLENQEYVGPYPTPSDFGVSAMSTDERKSFLVWHQKKIEDNDIFDFRREMDVYCSQDVTILRMACMKFRDLFMKATRTVGSEDPSDSVKGAIDPFKYVTIASVCMVVMKTKFLQEEHKTVFLHKASPCRRVNGQAFFKDNTWSYVIEGVTMTEEEMTKSWKVIKKQFKSSDIAQVPRAGYSNDTYSDKSIKWLKWMERKHEGWDIQHALNGGEHKVKVGGQFLRLDGYEETSNLAMEFLGCYFHACRTCFPNREAIHALKGVPMYVLYYNTLSRESALRQKGYNYMAIWECEFDSKVAGDPEMASFVQDCEIVPRLQARDSFFGGRTNAAKLYHKTEGSQKIKYSDFKSLYPSVNKQAEYPIGHPVVITMNDLPENARIEDYFGIAKVKVLPPSHLYFPVLPYRSQGKLKFPLCRTCADNETQSLCTCTDEDRAWIGTWCIPELEKAIELGYEVQKIYEIYHWNVTKVINKDFGENGLFGEYVNTFLKLKEEASGWPAERTTEEDREHFLQEYFLQ